MLTSSIEFEGQDLGVGDFVLLSNVTMEEFVENLKRRFERGRIYTYIDEVLVSVNPYRNLPLYRPEYIKSYQGCEMFERPAHIFALAEAAYQTLRRNSMNSSIVISGESGSGKTEAFKIILSYLTSVTTSSNENEIQRMNTILLQTNVILETFGNSRTIRNDNSSRFGKYLHLNFHPISGRIQYYLLEKSRVVKQQIGERNFHAFYQLFTDKQVKEKYGLNLSPNEYAYINQGNCCQVEEMNDRQNYKQVLEGLSLVGLKEEEISTIWKIIAAIIHFGNIIFTDVAGEDCSINDSDNRLEWISKLLECEQSEIFAALNSRMVAARNEVIQTNQNITGAVQGRDALSKALYERLFEWLIGRINENFSPEDSEGRNNLHEKRILSVLDLYGFENFENNSFEQLCINYSNEKLQQLFIKLVLRREQEEYENENIAWQHIDYFNNKVICELIEQPRIGLLTLLDEACHLAESGTDETFLETMNKTFKNHEYYSSWKLASTKTLWKKADSNKLFLIRHYAGDVVYSVDGFLEKNRDTLCEHFKRLLYRSRNPLISAMWSKGEKSITRQPLTMGNAFRNSMISLSELLLSKQVFFIRCIKPNNEKAQNIFDQGLIEHQISYLGLLETIGVRRAGFCYRSTYDRFVQRYKIIDCVRAKLFPNAPLTEESAAYICNELRMENDVAYGNTKLFIKQPISLLELEKQRTESVQTISVILQKHVRAWKQRREFQKEISAVRIQYFYRKHRARSYINPLFQSFSEHLGKNMPWPIPHSSFIHIDEILNRVYRRWRIKQIKEGFPVEQQSIFQFKLRAGRYLQQRSSFFDMSIQQAWKGDYLLSPEENSRWNEYQKLINDLRKRDQFTQVFFSIFAVKLNSRIRMDERAIILTDKFIYKADPKRNFQVKKSGLPIEEITGLSLTPGKEQLIVIHTITNHDLVFYMDTKIDRVGELVGYIVHLKQQSSEFFVNVQRNVSINVFKDKYLIDIIWDHLGKIEFRKGANNNISLVLPDN